MQLRVSGEEMTFNFILIPTYFSANTYSILGRTITGGPSLFSKFISFSCVAEGIFFAKATKPKFGLSQVQGTLFHRRILFFSK